MRRLVVLALLTLGCREATAATGSGVLTVRLDASCAIPRNTPITFTLDGVSQGWLAYSPSWSWSTSVPAGQHTSSAAMDGHAWPTTSDVVSSGGTVTRTLACP